MNKQEKRQIQAAALTLAEHQHKDDPKIKVIRDHVITMRQDLAKHEEALRNMQRDLNVETLNMRKALMPYIPEDLRD